MNGQISLLNAISEKEPQTSNVERQTLPKGANAFALLMAGNHSSKSIPTSKSVEKHNTEADSGKEAVASTEQVSTDKKIKESDSDSKSAKKALDDVLPQLSLKDTPLTVSKDSPSQTVSTQSPSTPADETISVEDAGIAPPSTEVADGKDTVDTDALVNVPVQTDGNATLPSVSPVAADSSVTDVSNLETDEAGAANTQSVTTVSSSIATSAPVAALSADDEPSPSVVDKKTNGQVVASQDVNVNANKATGVDASKVATPAPVAQERNVVDNSSTPVQQSLVDSHKVNTHQTNLTVNAVNNDQASTPAASVQSTPNPAITAEVATAATPATDKSQVAMASQYTGNQVTASATTTSTSTTTVSSATTSSSDNSLNSQSGQQGGGQQSFSQNGQGNPSSQSNLLNQFVQSQMQAHQAAVQQAAVKNFNDLSMGADSTSSDSSKLLGGLGFDNKAQLPPGMQGIVYSLRSPQWSQALGQRMIYMANNKVQEAKITLNPEKLGPVQIKLHLDKNQQVHVAMSAHHHMTKETMEAAIPKLREMFDSAGIDLGSIDVNQDSQFEAQQQNNEQGNQQGKTFGQSLSADESEHESAPVIVKQTDGLIDYYA
ncbi:hypothetical protein EI16_03625 [Hydrogenovibrio marinus]|uniref:Flagellar hook-length control protein-like C-terminal domain-containing protein n=2 Tax=Hydrogenovibrio marinus TaxID=28885 RepID=A0A066ZSY8_HYDMR|nr:flagellar hook-length control protein FliK [Hydrogenovibrio marinus]KDN95399.1 hypothetical protein EI16_03625 [Hydrogenovibrio marinus]BBN59888.1 hypothetical protein HVMH_1482 [Hydrogenovibrio marinus]